MQMLETMIFGGGSLKRQGGCQPTCIDSSHTKEARKVGKVLTTNTTNWFLLQEQLEAAKPMCPNNSYSMKGEGKPFSTSWLVDVERAYMPPNLDHHWVVVEMNLAARRIMVYDSLMSKTNARKANAKLAPLASVLSDFLQSLSNEVKNGPWPIILCPKSPKQANKIMAANVPEKQLRMANNILHGLHNV
ncbi:hypothetical protein D8674_024650 [Pyrus ussuriensis x Pyrus communis]|uniref:Ubiquitin-like protease family profile domain-containing protein n=1 Tax=Pyrus ussuriensis x Pyrus communis TaxID=2448454 RepID=A0A5N5H4I2_9ROSA|nr:hypothetical protein D8674_024650 [Pyrus ussuriensis x Pyrus communis]